MNSRIERYATWLESLPTAAYGFKKRAQQQRAHEIAAILRAQEAENDELKSLLKKVADEKIRASGQNRRDLDNVLLAAEAWLEQKPTGMGSNIRAERQALVMGAVRRLRHLLSPENAEE